MEDSERSIGSEGRKKGKETLLCARGSEVSAIQSRRIVPNPSLFLWCVLGRRSWCRFSAGAMHVERLQPCICSIGAST